MIQNSSIFFLMGPTASGKTEMALALAHRFPCDIISVDSAMVYRGLDIGTAKPDAGILHRTPHRLIDICDPGEAYSVARFCQDAQREIVAIQAADRIPLLVGGTMLYFHALQRGLSDLPVSDEAIRTRIGEEMQRYGLAALYRRLADIDPGAAARIHPNDPQRIRRALEVYETEGVTMSEYLSRRPPEPWFKNNVKFVVACLDRSDSARRIADRFHAMLERGLITEVEMLYARKDLHAGLPALRSVGYRQVWRYLSGEITYRNMTDQAIIATQQLAKRQWTWLRREKNSAFWFDGADRKMSEKLISTVARCLNA